MTPIRLNPAHLPRAYGYLRRLLMPLGVDFSLDLDDRRVLETIILPYLRDREDFRTVLFVGCDWYTRSYRTFFARKTYWTMDSNPYQRRFGTSRHIVDTMESLALHFGPSELDVIVCNGVYGYGLDTLDQFDEALLACHRSLRTNGLFILGWDDNPRRTPFPLAASRSLALFEECCFPPLGTHRYLTANPGRHTFGFFAKSG